MSNQSLFVNGRFLSQRPSGVHRFAFEMCEALYRLGIDFTVVAPRDMHPSYNPHFKIVHVGKVSNHLWEQIVLPLFLLRQHNPYLISFSGLGPVFYGRHIATIHDLAFIVNPKWYNALYAFYYRVMTPILARNARGIITVSNSSKDEIVRYLRVDENKIGVVYNAVSPLILSQTDDNDMQLPVTGPYILSVSSIDPRKNFLRLIESFNRLGDPNMKLVIVGGNSKSFSKMNFDESLLENVVFTGHVGNDELAAYYRNARLFVYPSLYEGFGIPPIESLSLGCPILLSDIAVFHEVCGDSAFYCDPMDVNSISSQIEYVLDHYDVAMRKVAEAGDLSLKYSWDKSAQELADFIKEIFPQ